MFFEALLLFLTCLLIWYYKTRLPSTYPPTPPIRLPLIGHGLYLLGYKNSQEAFNHLCEKVIMDFWTDIGVFFSVCQRIGDQGPFLKKLLGGYLGNCNKVPELGAFINTWKFNKIKHKLYCSYLIYILCNIYNIYCSYLIVLKTGLNLVWFNLRELIKGLNALLQFFLYNTNWRNILLQRKNHWGMIANTFLQRRSSVHTFFL